MGFRYPIERKIKNNKPDIVIKDYKRKKYLLIGISIPTDNNVSVKEHHNISKYKIHSSEGERNSATGVRTHTLRCHSPII